uniref:Uncharacterized protein n=1 Tax=Candidatus Kentrum sp. FM TaxID=2126340 RepID=A0A450SMN1_9GAMM|nr:MAG: hypothetical protein BECKFM1743C_GA0114222_100083 [Candidatus Kentron sp. FM]VFJ55052.1 MAG: hypothetical protein BECKFM1743A_GA0114220_101413 [Candidatus Kentron sp. FM]VFK10937.1 MAG: hypothetical protein BECKFM1743B_GA0114221_101613 [Candidatus Kentron sp. FM]
MIGFQPRLGVQSHWFLFAILAATLLLPVVVLWGVIEGFYTESITQCDRIFWDVAVVENGWWFPFRFFGETLLSYPLMPLVLISSLFFAVLAFLQGLHLLRPRDFPAIPLLLFALLIVFTGLVYWESLDIFTKGKIEQKLGDRAERVHLLQRNLDRLRIALDEIGVAKTVQQLREVADGLRFAGGAAHRMGSMNAGALFSDASSLPLFEDCKENVGILVPIQNPDGFSEHKSVNVECSMPIEYGRVTEGHWSGTKLKYFHEVLGIGYLFGPLWWIYLLLLLSPVWTFFIVFGLYRFGVLKVRAAGSRSK